MIRKLTLKFTTRDDAVRLRDAGVPQESYRSQVMNEWQEFLPQNKRERAMSIEYIDFPALGDLSLDFSDRQFLMNLRLNVGVTPKCIECLWD